MKTYIPYRLTGHNVLSLIILAIVFSLTLHANAQTADKGKLLEMIEQDRTTLDQIAGYDQQIQRHVLQIAQTPEALNKIEELQKRSQSEFRNIINRYNRDTQSAFYELARYPNLISDLVRTGTPSSSEVTRIASNYPDDIRPVAKKYARRYIDVLVRIDRLNNEIDRAFQMYLEPYSSRTRESVNVLLAYPEIVSALIDDMSFTVVLGDVYSDDPRWTERYLAQVSRQLAEQKERDLEAYRDQITNDPEAYNEMLAASERFARENNEVRYINNYSPTVEITVINSYPYWFGYPHWYSAPYWRPRPVYYHTGFYRNNFGAVVFVGLPSFHFLHWHTHYHPTLFPHLSYNYYSYYENHYSKYYRNSHRPVPYHGFYRSIEANVIHNPRVNNSTLERIDKQRGRDIVRKPNTMNYGSASANRRGEASGVRRSETGSATNQRGTTGTTRETVTGRRTDQSGSARSGNEMNRSGSNTTSRGTTGTVNRRQSTPTNQGTSGSGSVNRRQSTAPGQGAPAGSSTRRQYNTVNPGKTEGPVNRSSSESGSRTIRRESAPSVTTPSGTSSGRTDQGTSIYRRSPESGRTNAGRSEYNTAPSMNRQRTTSSSAGNGTVIQQQSRAERVAPQQRTSSVSSQRTPEKVERSSAPARREAASSGRKTSVEPVRRQSNASISPAPDRSAAREMQTSSSRGESSRSSNNTGSSRRQR